LTKDLVDSSFFDGKNKTKFKERNKKRTDDEEENIHDGVFPAAFFHFFSFNLNHGDLMLKSRPS
jgi:hypothetical protein